MLQYQTVIDTNNYTLKAENNNIKFEKKLWKKPLQKVEPNQLALSDDS